MIRAQWFDVFMSAIFKNIGRTEKYTFMYHSYQIQRAH